MKKKFFYDMPKIAPKLNDWVWIEKYVDFALDQRELARVGWYEYKGEHAFCMKGHARHGSWKYTQFELAINLSRNTKLQCPWDFIYLGKDGCNDIWLATWKFYKKSLKNKIL